MKPVITFEEQNQITIDLMFRNNLISTCMYQDEPCKAIGLTN